MPTLLLAIALLGTGCCLSVGPEGIADTTGSGEASAGQATSGQGSGSQASTGGSATTGGCGGFPYAVDFGPTLINTTAKRSVILPNCGTSAVTGINTTVTGSDANLFTVNNVPATLGPGDSATVNISYSPLALETRSVANVTFWGSGAAKVILNLFGEPVAFALTVAPNPCDFGHVALGTTAVCCSTVSNQANETVSISGVGSFDNEGGAFGVATTDDSTPPNPQSFPINIPGGESAKVCFSFMPPIAQQYSGQATLLTNDPSGTNPIIQLAGWGGVP